MKLQLSINHRDFNGKNFTRPYVLASLRELDGTPIITKERKAEGYKGIVLPEGHALNKSFKFSDENTKELPKEGSFKIEVNENNIAEIGNYIVADNFKVLGGTEQKGKRVYFANLANNEEGDDVAPF